jgi:RNA polymerase sigma-70 factor (ECF subfamily)
MSRLHRGRKQLREKLADYAKELGYSVATSKKAVAAEKKALEGGVSEE